MQRKRQRPGMSLRALASVGVVMLVRGGSPGAVSAFQAVPRPTGMRSRGRRTTSSPTQEPLPLVSDEVAAARGSAADLFVSGSRTSAAPPKELPPWLAPYESLTNDGDNGSHGNTVADQIQWLAYALGKQGLDASDRGLILAKVERVAAEDQALAAGMVDFVRLLLSLRHHEQHHEGEDEAGFFTTAVLLAGMLHYEDCIAARRRGMPDLVRDALRRTVSPTTSNSKPLALPSSMGSASSSPSPTSGMQIIESPNPVLRPDTPLGSARAPPSHALLALAKASSTSATEAQVRRICTGAARIKRAEVLAQAVLGDEILTPARAARLRNLYLTCMEDDWRSLALRVVACLYRLDGICRHLQQQHASLEYTARSPATVQTAREALRIYAPLAQRLGMHRLKAMLEERAFRVLYRRQYRAVSALYLETGEVMQSVSQYLQSHLQQILRQDPALAAQLETVQVVARVKEPYSFWRKLLKQKFEGRLMLNPATDDQEDDTTTGSASSSLSIAQVNDGIALRVILRARRLDPSETDEALRAREGLLCYYAQHLIRAQWPETDATRLKDYIARPKANGYKSLHHTSQIASRGIQFPFEVQVRSSEMHAQAEFGVSAHWDYKLAGQKEASSGALAPRALAAASLHETAALWALADESVEDGTVDMPELSTSRVLTESYVDALMTAKDDILKKQIYVFIVGGPEAQDQGELISVPVDSSVGDAIEDIEGMLSAKVQVWRNGRPADTTDRLENGDVMMIHV